MNGTPHDRALKELCPPLKLKEWEQDWPIIVADANRVDEFCEFFLAHPELSPLARSLLFELILASLNEALERTTMSDDALDRYAALLRRFASQFPVEVNNWISLEPTAADPFPVTSWMKQVLTAT